MIDPKWRIQFQHQADVTEAWYQLEKPKGSLLLWALKRGDIGFREYTSWAQSQYHLPIIDDDFFSNAPEPTFINRMSIPYPWNSECMPIATWSGITYVGCLAPPVNLPKDSGQLCVVLASPDQLQNWWERIKSRIADLESSDPEMALAKDLGSGPTHEVEDPFEALSQNNAPLAEGTFTPAVETRTKDLKTAINEGLASISGGGGSDKTENFKMPQITDQSILLVAQKKFGDRFNSVMDQCFNRLKRYYKKSMIWTIQGNVIAPLYWEKDFDPQPEYQKETIALETPSIFRIVYRSHKPYHGYIVMNKINEEFVSNWNNGVTPEHVTITPIMINSELHGMIVSVGEADISLRQSLHLCNAASKQLAYDITDTLGLAKTSQSA